MIWYYYSLFVYTLKYIN